MDTNTKTDVDKQTLLLLFRTMQVIRQCEEQLAKSHQRGLVHGACHTYVGEEAIAAGGGDFDLAAWDWRLYTDRIRRERYALDDSEVRAYFSLENVLQGAFTVAHRLYGISFTELDDLPVYHPDVRTFEVKDEDGSHLGIFYADYHPRAGKRGGAWSSRFRPLELPLDMYSLPSGPKFKPCSECSRLPRPV